MLRASKISFSAAQSSSISNDATSGSTGGGAEELGGGSEQVGGIVSVRNPETPLLIWPASVE